MNIPQQPPFNIPSGIPGMPTSSVGEASASSSKKAKKQKAAKAPKAANKGRTPTAREQARRNGVIALVLALVAAVGGFAVMNKPAEQLVYVARVGNPNGLMAGRQVVASDIEYFAMPLMYVEPGAAVAYDKASLEAYLSGSLKAIVMQGSQQVQVDWTVVGRRPKYPLLVNQQIHPIPVFSEAIELAVKLGPDESLIAISASPDRAILGQLRAGDIVDVVAAVTGEEAATPSEGPAVTTPYQVGPGPVVVASKVEIVSVGSPATLGGTTANASTLPSIYLVRVPSSMALTLAKLDAGQPGVRLYLLLRGNVQDEAAAPSTTVAPGR